MHNNAHNLQSLHDRPGFMIRRAHQIAQTLFLEETGDLNITPTQYGVLRILEARPGLDQIGVAKLLGQDRSTTALVLTKLENDGLIERQTSNEDRRRRVLALSSSGKCILEKLAEPVHRSHDRLLSAFTEEEGLTFLALLQKFLDRFNETARAPLTVSLASSDGERRAADSS